MDQTKRKITKIAREISKVYPKMLKVEGVGVAEYDFIHVVRKNPGITQKEICKILGIDKGAAARRSKNLESKGYIRKENNLQDKRSQHLYACEKAEALKINKGMVEALAYEWLLEDLDAKEKEQFCFLLDKIYQKSKQESKSDFVHLKNVVQGK